MTLDQQSTAPAESRLWFYKTEQGKAGPIETEAFCAKLASCGLAPETLVWRDGLAAWIPAADCEELRHAVAAGRIAAPASARPRRRPLPLAAGVLLFAVAMPASWLVIRWLLSEMAVATVTGTVTAESKPVTGGSVILSPKSEPKANAPGKPGVAVIGPDGTYRVRLEPGSEGLAKRFIVRFSPPVLPVMSESEASRALPPYHGFVPSVGEVSIHAGANTLDIEIGPSAR